LRVVVVLAITWAAGSAAGRIWVTRLQPRRRSSIPPVDTLCRRHPRHRSRRQVLDQYSTNRRPAHMSSLGIAAPCTSSSTCSVTGPTTRASSCSGTATGVCLLCLMVLYRGRLVPTSDQAGTSFRVACSNNRVVVLPCLLEWGSDRRNSMSARSAAEFCRRLG
jgi:hypothetical protein